MNLFWNQLQYLKKNFHKPYSTVRYFEELPLTPEQRHVLYGFILKMYGGYSVQTIEVQMNITLILIVEAFLQFEGDTPEKEYCKSPDAFAFINNKYISLKPLPQSYKFSSTDFSGIAADYDWDYFLNIDNNRVQFSLILPLKKYFQEGKRAGYIEPLAFMNLFWMHYNRLLNCETKIRSFTDSLKELPISDEVRHILYGWLLKFHGGYPYQMQGLWYDNVFPVLEKEFLAYEGNTPEKWNCLRPDEYERRVNEAMGLPNVQTPNEKGVVVEVAKINTPNETKVEAKYSNPIPKNNFNSMECEKIREHFKDLTLNKSANEEPHLTDDELDCFIYKAFYEKNPPNPKFKLNYRRGDIHTIRRIFYDYFNVCRYEYESNSNVKEKYVRLLTDYFNGFKFETVFANFNK